jgi:hypothetical protein
VSGIRGKMEGGILKVKIVEYDNPSQGIPNVEISGRGQDIPVVMGVTGMDGVCTLKRRWLV